MDHLVERRVTIPIGPRTLEGILRVPADARGLVLFAHGSGSSRHSPRNRFVASVLEDAGLATLLFDLLTEGEAADRRNVFDIPLLAGRVVAAIEAAGSWEATAELPVALFGASTGAAAALLAAAQSATTGRPVRAVVSRGGRPDLAGPALARVTVPVLLLVGGEDLDVLELNRIAAARLVGPCAIEVVPGATHLFEEPGTLEQVADRAAAWLIERLDDDRGGEDRP